VTYVGELGWELHMPVETTVAVYDRLTAAGAPHGLVDAGYRAIESLRLEKGYRAWGADIGPDHTPLEAGLGWAVKLKQNAPLFEGVKGANALVRGTWGAAPADGLEPQDGDHVVEKMRMNGFYETRLDILLRGLGVETLIITGAWTNMSIEHTARHAADAGYRAVVASDGTSTVGDEWQRAALEYAMTNVASVGTCSEIAAALGA